LEFNVKPTATFFDEQREQSEVKANIVAKYFDAWSNVMLGAKRQFGHFNRMAYIDLFAGPGRYSDGSKSTPLMVLELAISRPELAKVLVTMFNDRDATNVASLKAEIENLPGYDTLNHKPKIYCSEVGQDATDMFASTKQCPTFTFVDPFGYKGLSRGIIQSIVKEWGCDCVVFFNYSRINAGLNNDAVRSHMDALFGQERVESMRVSMAGMKPHEREPFVLENLAAALKDLGAKFVLPFRFRRADGSRTSHSLVFVTKDEKGYEIMKDIMARESSTEDEGVASFTYSPADARCPLLFSLSRPLAALTEDLVSRFEGQTLTMMQVYKAHHIDTPFVAKNYKQALGDLEAAGRIVAVPAAPARPKRMGKPTFGDTVRVSFPKAA
jgi:three-Cys-motif partner protein